MSPLALAHMHMDADTGVPICMHTVINTVLQGKMSALP